MVRKIPQKLPKCVVQALNDITNDYSPDCINKLLDEFISFDNYEFIYEEPILNDLLLQFIKLTLEENKQLRLNTEPNCDNEQINIKKFSVEIAETNNTEIKPDIAILKSQIINGIALTKEFRESIGHELILDEQEWRPALKNMLLAQCKIDIGNDPKGIYKNVLLLEKAHLAELIMERIIYKTDNVEQYGYWSKELPGNFVFTLNVKNEDLMSIVKHQIQSVYGYESFKIIENGGITKIAVDDSAIIKKGNNLTEGHWQLLNFAILKRLIAYNSNTLFPLPNINEVSVELNKIGDQLKSPLLLKSNKNTFDQAVDSIINKILNSEVDKLNELKTVYTEHDENVQQLINEHHNDKWPISKNLILEDPDLTKTSEIQTKLELLKNELSKKISYINEQAKYIKYNYYCKHLSLLGLLRYFGFSSLSTDELLSIFKARMGELYNQEQHYIVSLQSVKITIDRLHKEIDRLISDQQHLNRRLLELNANHNYADNQSRDSTIKTIHYELTRVEQDLNKCLGQLQEFIQQEKKQAVNYRQFQTKINLAKRQALGLIPPVRPNYLIDFIKYNDFIGSAKNLESFVLAINCLTKQNKDTNDYNKLMLYADEIINELPSLDLPDTVDVNGLQCNNENIHDIIKAFIILDQARQAIKLRLNTDFHNLDLHATNHTIQDAFLQLCCKIINHPLHAALLQLQLLPTNLQNSYIGQIEQLRNLPTVDQNALKCLNNKIIQDIEQHLLEFNKFKLDEQLTNMDDLGFCIKDNIILYNGLIKYLIIMQEVSLLLAKARKYFENCDLSSDEISARQLKFSKVEIALANLSTNYPAIIAHVYDLAKQNFEHQKIIDFFIEELQYYLMQINDLVDGQISGYGFCKVSGIVSSILHKALRYKIFEELHAVVPYVSAICGDYLQFETAKLSIQYHDCNLSQLLTSEDFHVIHNADYKFKITTLSDQNLEIKLTKIHDKYSHYLTHFKNLILNFSPSKAIKLKIILFITVSCFMVLLAKFLVSPASIPACFSKIGFGILMSIFGMGFIMLIRAKKLPLLQRIYNNAIEKIDVMYNKTSLLTAKFQLVNKDSQLNDLINLLNVNLQSQMNLINTRIKACNPYDILCTRFHHNEDEITREIYCLEEIATLQEQLLNTLQILDENSVTNQSPNSTYNANFDTFVQLIDNFLIENYSFYHKTHIVDLSALHGARYISNINMDVVEAELAQEMSVIKSMLAIKDKLTEFSINKQSRH